MSEEKVERSKAAIAKLNDFSYLKDRREQNRPRNEELRQSEELKLADTPMLDKLRKKNEEMRARNQQTAARGMCYGSKNGCMCMWCCYDDVYPRYVERNDR